MSASPTTLELYQVDAFTREPFRGNPAAVCPLMRWLPDETMQRIALENNLSETAFVSPEDDLFRLRWFTPVAEVDLCGHATLGTAAVLHERLGADCPNPLRFATKSGELTVTRNDDGSFSMDFPARTAERCDVPALVGDALGVAPQEMLLADRDYLAVFASEAEVAALTPDFGTLEKLSPPGLIVSALGDDVDFVSRFFVPALGVAEDPVTGSTHCTLTPYWADRLGKTTLRARQISARTGDLLCESRENRVIISGHAVLVMQGKMTF